MPGSARSVRFVAAVLLAMALVLAGCASTARVAHEAAGPLDVVTLNLWHDKQDWPHRQDMIVAELRTLAPDVIVLQEVLQDVALPNQAQVLASRLGYDYRFFSVDAPSQARRYGNAILVRGKIEASREVKLVPLDDYRNAGWVRATVQGRPLNLYATHLHHTPEGGAIRAEQVAGVLELIEATAGDVPSVLGGDFNTRSDTPELTALKATFAEAHAGQDTNSPAHTTLNTHLGHPPERIDHVFVQRGAFRVVDARIILDQADAAGAWPSDHYGVWVRVMQSDVPRR
ncbi:MAG TPA: endonuclease/exonuclease/phosphatase family protein [Pseudoxanthomonas sp.]